MCRLQESVNNIGYIIIDEYSVLGQVSFGWVDKRCKQATGYKDKAVGEQGHQAYHMFEKVVKLTVNQRVQGMTSEQAQFRDLLLRPCKGESIVDDWKLLLTRQPSNVTIIYVTLKMLLDFFIVMNKLLITATSS